MIQNDSRRFETEWALLRTGPRKSLPSWLSSGDALRLKPEPTNEFNGNAHLLVCHDGRSVGYVPDYLVDDLKSLMDQDDSLKVEVVQVNAPPAPSQQRLLCKLSISATAPRPHRGARFEPISVAATRLEQPSAALGSLHRRAG